MRLGKRKKTHNSHTIHYFDMITRNNIEEILLSEPFNFQKEHGVYTRHYGTPDEGFDLSYNYGAGTFNYPEGVEADRNTTLDNHQKESFVVFLCVAQLFALGYQPKHFKLEGKNYSGTDKGFCDILVKDNDGEAYLIIECKTADLAKKDDEFRKYWAKTMRNGDQLFRYFNTYRKAQYLCMLAADFPEYKKENGTKSHKFEFIYHLISLVDNDEYLKTDPSLCSFRQQREEQGGSEDFFNVWKQTYKQDYNTRGLMEKGIEAFKIGKKSYNLDDLDTVNEYSLNKKYNEFAVILRKHTISSHENAFDKLVNLFLSKIIDEKYNGKELTFLWKGAAYDDYFSLQDRLNILYRTGMWEFFGDEVTYIENNQIDEAFSFLTSKADEGKNTIKRYFRKLKYFNNNPFAFLDVHNEELFFKNAVILKDVISMLQGIYLTKDTGNQFLGDLFEGYLNKGVHQSEGQFFTPIPIVRFLVSSLPLEKIIEQNNGIPRVIDYACGSGHFLTEYAHQIQKVVDKDAIKHYYEQIVGIERDYRLSKVSQVAAFMYGMDGIRVHFSDALVGIPDVKDHSFDILVANPPYSVSGFLETLSEEEQQRYTLSQFVSNPEKNNSIETFFIERASQLLTPGGVATIILPPSILSNGNLYMRTRELLLRDFDIVAICCFGKNTFGQTNTATVALFLRRKALEPNLASHLQNRLNSWFSGNMADDESYKDSHLLDAYLERMGYRREDYIAMMKGQLTDTFLRTEMVQDYIKALNIPKNGDNTSATAMAIEARKVRDEAQKYVDNRDFKDLTLEGQKNVITQYRLRFIQAIEKEKLFYFMLASFNPQPVLVVLAPETKDDEKKYLGYEWSTRKGTEGIHYLNTGKIQDAGQDDEDAEDDTINQIFGIDDIITPLFNPKDLSDSSKINSFIRVNFDGTEDIDIPEELSSTVYMYSLTDLLTFSNVEFSKDIVTKPILSLPKINTSYPSDTIKNIAPYVTEKVSLSSISPDNYVSTENMLPNRRGVKRYEGTPAIDRVSAFKKGDILISNIRPYLRKIWYANSNGGCSNDILVFRNIASDRLRNDYLYQVLSSDTFFDYMTGGSKGVKMPRGNKKLILKFEVPIPPLDIQQKIAEECLDIDLKTKQKEETIKLLKAKMNQLFIDSLSENLDDVKLSDICDMQAGKFVPANKIFKHPTDIYKYPCFGGNGLRGYTDTMTNEGDYIIIGRQGALCGNVCMAHGSFHATEHAVVVYPHANVDNQWLKYLLIDMNLNQYSTGRAQPGLSVQKLLSVRTSIPKSIEIQHAVAEQILQCEREIDTLQQEIAMCPTLKQAILDKYLK